MINRTKRVSSGFWIPICMAVFLLLIMLGACTPSGPGNCGRRIAFLSTRDRPEGDLFLVNPDGSDLVKVDLSTVDAELHQISWSPTCESILISTMGGVGDVYVVRLDGSEPTLVSNFEVKYGLITHIYDLYGVEADLAPYDELSAEEMDELHDDVQFGGGFFAAFPDWSPDGQQIVFSAGGISGDGGFMYSGIYLVSIDGSGFRPLFDDREVVVAGYAEDADQGYSEDVVRLGSVFELLPRWLPDGEQITFYSLITENLYRASSDGSQMTRILATDGELGAFAISPDGQRIAFETDGQLLMAGMDDIEQAEAIGEWQVWSMVWSPNGEQLAFLDGLEDLYVVNGDGSGLVRLAQDIPSDAVYSWAPDGSQLVFSDGQDIYVIHADGTERFNLTENTGISTSPIWSPGAMVIGFSW